MTALYQCLHPTVSLAIRDSPRSNFEIPESLHNSREKPMALTGVLHCLQESTVAAFFAELISRGSRCKKGHGLINPDHEQPRGQDIENNPLSGDSLPFSRSL
jgi:hypothetical protein